MCVEKSEVKMHSPSTLFNVNNKCITRCLWLHMINEYKALELTLISSRIMKESFSFDSLYNNRLKDVLKMAVGLQLKFLELPNLKWCWWHFVGSNASAHIRSFVLACLASCVLGDFCPVSFHDVPKCKLQRLPTQWKLTRKTFRTLARHSHKVHMLKQIRN